MPRLTIMMAPVVRIVLPIVTRGRRVSLTWPWFAGAGHAPVGEYLPRFFRLGLGIK